MFSAPFGKTLVSGHYPIEKVGSEIGALIRSKDWSSSSLGSPSAWPPALLFTLNLMLKSRFPMFLWWGKDCVMLYNDAYLTIAGSRHPGSFGGLGREIWPELWDVLGPLVDSVLCEGISTWSEDQLMYVIRDGVFKENYFTYSHSPIEDEFGQIGGVLCIVHETTEKVMGVKRLKESEQNLRNLVMQAPVGICIINKDNLSAEVFNDTFLEVVGKDRKEFEQHSFWEVLSEVEEHNAAILNNVFNTGIAFYGKEYEVTLIRKGKAETIFVDYVYEPLREPDGTIQKLMIMVIDITEKVKARINVEEVNQQLKTTNAELKQFAYIASHDMQEPLRKISTYATMLDESLGTVSEPSRGYLNKIYDSSSKMLSLIKDILTYSQLTKESKVFKQVNLTQVFEQVIEDFELLIEQKDATIEYAHLPVIEAIPLQMMQLFNNLLSNSLKYGKVDEKPVITVTSKKLDLEEVKGYHLLNREATYHKIQFKDNGIGFNQEYADRIFHIFQRLHIKTKYSGTGIGLAICKKIAENHHGIIFATAVNNEGAVFTVILPEKQG